MDLKSISKENVPEPSSIVRLDCNFVRSPKIKSRSNFDRTLQTLGDLVICNFLKFHCSKNFPSLAFSFS